ncbi:MAG: RHS repeat-associated core domain-containing protein [Armatimonadetes bacterium]|nr:RHS repeat-associated core domain-containing protein [Armatimonadota bacterium]
MARAARRPTATTPLGRTTSVTTAGGTTNLTYDYEDRVKSITYPGGATNTFAYNGLDTRTQKVDSSGTKNYRRDGVGVTDPVLSDGVSTFTPGTSIRTGSTSTYTTSGLKNATGQTNASAALIATRTYDAFGNQTANTGTWSGPFGYAGQFGYQEDADSGLKLLGHRYYDPSTGRFLTRDPAEDGSNWYIYCGNNPVASADVDGLEVVRIIYGPKRGDDITYDFQRLAELLIRKYKNGKNDVKYMIRPSESDMRRELTGADIVIILAHGNTDYFLIGSMGLSAAALLKLINSLRGGKPWDELDLYSCDVVTDENLQTLMRCAKRGSGYKGVHCYPGRVVRGEEVPNISWSAIGIGR